MRKWFRIIDKLWIDCTDPASVRIAKSLKENLKIDIKITVREGAGTREMATKLELDFETLGKHGGKDRYNKLMASINRLSILTEYAKNLQGFAFYTHSSVEGSRVAYGLGLYPIITTDDTPWSVHVAKLLLPLCDYHIIPSWSKDFWPINIRSSLITKE